MSARWSLRDATQEDVPSLFELHRTVFQPHIEKLWGWEEDWQLSRFRQEFASSKTSVIRVAGRTVGYVQTVSDTGQLYLRNIALHPDAQGCGIGTYLLGKLQEEATARGVPLNLSIFRTNPRALSFYERLGFRKTREDETSFKMTWSSDAREGEA